MKFETKFNINERAWYMKYNKPTEVIISAIEVFCVDTNQVRIKYNAKNVLNSVSWLDHTNLMENALFKSKTELMRALFSVDEALCKGIEVESGVFSGCDQSAGDCPMCGK